MLLWSLDQGKKSLDIELHRILIPSLLRFFCQAYLLQERGKRKPCSSELYKVAIRPDINDFLP